MINNNRTTYEDGVEAFQERHAVDEIQALTSRRANGVDNEINIARSTADGGIECPLGGNVSTTSVVDSFMRLTGQICALAVNS